MIFALRGWLVVGITGVVAQVAFAADVTVSAASSLTNAFQDIGRAFEAQNADTRVLFNFGASGSLVQQITRGAPVDVFAAADQESMDRAQSGGAVERASRFNFARNQLVVALPIDSAMKINELTDVAKSEIQRVAIGNPDSVPAGRYAKVALEKAGIWEQVKPKAINTVNVRQALDYVARAETDLAFVYLTDAQIMAKRVRVAFRVAVPEPILYPVATVRGGGNYAGGQKFAAFLRTEAAQSILAKYGFEKP